MRRVFTIPLLLALLVSMVAGCVQAPGQSIDAASTGDSSDAPIELLMWTDSNEAFFAQNEAMVNAFMAEHPNYKITVEQFPSSDLMTKLRTAFTSNELPDLIQIFGSEVVPFIKAGLLSPAPDDLQTEINAEFAPAGIGAFRGQTDGVIYGIPREINLESGGVLYYPENLKSVGYDVFPQTYDELMDAAQKLVQYDADGNIVKAGFDMFTTWNNLFYFYALILQQGGEYLAEDGTHVDYTNPESESALQAIADLFTKYKVTSFEHLSADDTWNSFFKGNSSMTFIGPWTIPLGKLNFDNDDFLYGKMPSFTGDSDAFVTETGWGMVVPNASAHQAAAWELAQFMTNEENSLAFNAGTGTIPARLSVMESEAFRAAADPRVATSLDILPEGRFVGYFPNLWATMEILEKHTRSVVEQGVSVPDALAAAEVETNQLIDELNAQ